MASVSAKGSLPHGWIVKTSKKYPDRVYYFNVVSGASTWECPELNPPRLPEDKEETYSKHTSILNKSSGDRLLFPVTEPEEAENYIECLVPTTKTLLAASERLTKSIESNNMHSKISSRKGLLPLPDKSIKTTLETNSMLSTCPAKSFKGKSPLLPLPEKSPLLSLPLKLPLLPLPETLPLLPLPRTLAINNLMSFKARKEFRLPEQSKALSSPAPMSRKRKLKGNVPLSSTADTSRVVINPPTAIVTPVVLEKNASTPSSSLPSSHNSIKLVYKNKRKQLKKQKLAIFSSSTPSTSKGVKEALEMPARSSSGSMFKNKSCLSVSAPVGGLHKTDKKVTVPSNRCTSSTSASSTENYDTDLDMTFEMEEPSSILSGIESNSCEDIEMLDVSADLTKIDDLAVPTQVADNLCSYYIVIDTNVLIDNLNRIDEIKDTPLNGCGPPHIFIPWIVIQELDALKRSTRTSRPGRAAQQAVRYLNKVLKSKHPRFHGQSPQEAEDCAKTYSECNDDKILECCMSLAQKMPPEKVVLITYDKNLINKALICDIVVHNWDSLMKAAKPDVIIQDLGISKKKRRKNKMTSLETPEQPSEETNQRNLGEKLIKEQDVCKTEIHTIMSEARQLLKDVLLSFLTEEMNEAYGDPWNAFPINKQLLNGILDAILRYWRTVFAFHFVEKDRRNIELLKEKVNRPEGFLGDREDCFGTLTAMEGIFCRIKRKWPQLEIPIKKVEDLRLRCNDTFTKHNSIDISISQVQSAINLSESDSVLLAFENAWTVINHLCGMVMDFYQIQHNFVYEKPDSIPSEIEFRRLMITLYPSVLNIKKLMLGVVAAIKTHNPRDQIFKDLYKALNELVPTLQIQANNPSVPNFNPKALEMYCRNPENTERVQLGCKQIEHFFSKLDHALKVMSSYKLDKCSDSMALD